jgi:serine/threonine protein phosphatase PrpC
MIPTQLTVEIGQCSDKGHKKVNQDFHGVCIPQEPLLSSKGIAIALADGISSSEVSQVASEAAVVGFLEDYYCTSEAWSVKTSVQRVLLATNSWLHAQTRQSQYRFNKDKGYVCTFSSLVIKSTTAHIFHVGDSRIYRLQGGSLEQLTEDHRHWVSKQESYLSRALGVNQQLEIDYQSFALDAGDIYILATDGIYEYASEPFIVEAVNAHQNDLDKAAKVILNEAYQQGSQDNLTIQIVRIEQLPQHNVDELYQQLTVLPFPPALDARMLFDGYKIIREVYISSRSHVFLAEDIENKAQVILKIPSMEQRDDVAYLERFLMEEWVARRINNAHVLKPCAQTRKRHYLYSVTEYIEGQTLAKWMRDHPKPDVETVRGIVEQIAKGLQAFHRQEMLHQDIRPNNIMIDQTGTVKIIDFGSARVTGVMEMTSPLHRHNILGTAQFTAPEYFLGEVGTIRSDLFSLGVIAYYMLSGRLPYGTEVAKARSKAAQRKLNYQSVLDDERAIPVWVDEALKKAVHPNPYHRYQELSEFIYDLRHPNPKFVFKNRPPLMERNPLAFWKGVSLILAMIIVFLLIKLDV